MIYVRRDDTNMNKHADITYQISYLFRCNSISNILTTTPSNTNSSSTHKYSTHLSIYPDERYSQRQMIQHNPPLYTKCMCTILDIIRVLCL